MKYATKVQSTSTVIASSQTVLLSAAYGGRYYLGIQNTGLGAVSIRFSSSSIGIGSGLTLDPAISPGGQGGSWEWLDAIPINAIWGYSAAGTTVVLLEAKS